MLIIIILIIILVLIFVNLSYEPFVTTIIDPYSVYLHKKISEKENLWNLMHTIKLYDYIQ